MNNPTTQILAFICCVLFQFASTATSDAQGKLGRIRSSVREHESPPSDDHHDSGHADDDDHDSGHADDHDRHHRDRRHHNRHSGGSGWFGAACSVFTPQPTVIVYEPNPTVYRDVYPGPPHHSPLNDPPFQETVSPVYETVVTPIVPPQFNQWGARITGFAGTDFDNISQGGFGVLFQVPGGIGLDSSVNMFRETGMTFRDHLWIGDVNIVKEIASNHLRARMGAGLNWMGDSFGGDAGFNLTAGLDYQISDRWMLAGEVDFGTLGDTDLLHTQISVSRKLEIAECVLGYDHYDIGGTTMGGAFVGLRFRF